MRKIFIYILVCCIPVSIVSCTSQAEKTVKNSQRVYADDVQATSTEHEFSTGQKEVNSEFEKFIREADSKIESTEKLISEIKLVSESDKNDFKDTNLKKIQNLEQRNDILKTELNEFIRVGDGNWYTFRDEFNREFKTLELACRNVSADIIQ